MTSLRRSSVRAQFPQAEAARVHELLVDAYAADVRVVPPHALVGQDGRVALDTPLELVELVPADEAVGDELEQPQRRVLVDGVGIALAEQARKLLLHAAEAFRERIFVNAPFGPPAYQADGLCLHVGEARRPLPAAFPEEVVQIVVTHSVLFFCG